MIIVPYLQYFEKSKYHLPKSKRNRVSLYCSGYWPSTIHKCNPATDPHGDFCLLRFRPGPVRPSLVNLVIHTSVRITMLMQNLAWTLDRHSTTTRRTPELKQSNSSDFQSSWITGARHNAQSRTNMNSKIYKIRAK